MWAIVTSAVYHPICTYMVRTYIRPLINTPPPTEGVIISQPIFRFLGVIFDGDHDFEGLRSPIALLDTLLRNLLSHPRPPRTIDYSYRVLEKQKMKTETNKNMQYICSVDSQPH